MTDEVSDAIALLTLRVRQLEAAEAARALLADYGAACDRHDLEAVTTMFVEDGCVEAGGQVWSGRQEIASFFREAWAADPSEKTHFIVNVQSGEVAGDSIAVRAMFLYTAAGQSSSVLGWGEYHDVMDLSGPRAALRSKSMDMRWAGDIRQGWASGAPDADAVRP